MKKGARIASLCSPSGQPPAGCLRYAPALLSAFVSSRLGRQLNEAEKLRSREANLRAPLALASLPKHKTRLQARFGRIFANVGTHGAEIVGLPEGIEGAEAVFVDETARNAFPALQRVEQRFAIAEGEEDVDVIGHDDIAPEVVALAVEVMEAVGDDLSEPWITQGAAAMGGVEVFVEFVGELAVVAGFGDAKSTWQLGWVVYNLAP